MNFIWKAKHIKHDWYLVCLPGRLFNRSYHAHKLNGVQECGHFEYLEWQGRIRPWGSNYLIGVERLHAEIPSEMHCWRVSAALECLPGDGKNLKGPNSHLRRSRVNRQEISCICCIGNFIAYKNVKKILYGFVDRRVLLKTRNLTWSTNISDDIGSNLLTGLVWYNLFQWYYH